MMSFDSLFQAQKKPHQCVAAGCRIMLQFSLLIIT